MQADRRSWEVLQSTERTPLSISHAVPRGRHERDAYGITIRLHVATRSCGDAFASDTHSSSYFLPLDGSG